MFASPSPSLPKVLIPIGRSASRLRSQIEAALGTISPSTRQGAAPVVWWSGESVAGRAFHRVASALVAAPGPILSPYDSPTTGLSSLRLSIVGQACGATPIQPAFREALGTLRLAGRNRFLRGSNASIAGAAEGDRPFTYLFVDAPTARSPAVLKSLVARARARFPAERLVIAGPDGCPAAIETAPDVVVITESVDPYPLFQQATSVATASDEAWCLATSSGASVVRLDRDADSGASWDRAYGHGVHYFDPWTRALIPPEAALDRVAWLRDRFAGNGRRIVLVGISRWKRPAIDVFADGPFGPPRHVMTAEDAVASAKTDGAEVQAWATRLPARLPALCADAGIPFARIEDGFLRSVGLGAGLTPGASIVVDDKGIYFDPRVDSRLTLLLRETDFSAELVECARRLRQDIVERRLSKYPNA